MQKPLFELKKTIRKISQVEESLKNLTQREEKKELNKKCLESESEPTFGTPATKEQTEALKSNWEHIGEQCLGVYEGFGVLKYDGTTCYRGNFRYGKFEGLGELQCNEGTKWMIEGEWETYLGEFKEGQPWGFGELLTNGIILRAYWENGVISERPKLRDLPKSLVEEMIN